MPSIHGTISRFNEIVGEQDILSKKIFKHLVRDFATYFFGLNLSEVELLETSNEHIDDRRSDLITRMTTVAGETFILHIDIQNDNQTKMAIRMLRYLCDILFAYPNFEVRQYLVYIGKKPMRMKSGLKLARLEYQYETIDMHQVRLQRPVVA